MAESDSGQMANLRACRSPACPGGADYGTLASGATRGQTMTVG